MDDYQELLTATRDRAAALASELAAEVGPERASVVRQRARVAAGPRPRPFSWLARPAAFCGPPDLVALKCRLLGLELAARYDPSATRLVLPGPERETLVPEFARAAGTFLEDGDTAFFRPGNDDYLKELAVLAHRLILLGPSAGAPRYMDPAGSVTAGVFVRGGPRQWLRAAGTLGLRTRALAPFLAYHLHVLNYRREEREDWDARGVRAAEIVEANPHLKGAIAGGWMVDPLVTRIAPNLAYIREKWLEAGARDFFVRYDREGRSGVSEGSRSRREAFERGEFVPRIWVVVWPRSVLLGWLERQRADGVA